MLLLGLVAVCALGAEVSDDRVRQYVEAGGTAEEKTNEAKDGVESRSGTATGRGGVADGARVKFTGDVDDEQISSRVITSDFGSYQPTPDFNNNQLDWRYNDFEEMTKFLRTTSSRYPNLTALYSIGKSVQGESPQT